MAGSSKVNAKLEKVINDLLKQVTSGKNEDGKPFSLTDKCKVVDRALKLEAIKQKADDAGYGSGFGTEEEGNDNDE